MSNNSNRRLNQNEIFPEDEEFYSFYKERITKAAQDIRSGCVSLEELKKEFNADSYQDVLDVLNELNKQ
jgi:hypothetical protein